MANFGVKILNNAKSSLAAQQAVIAGIGNNIANANTPGYVRRVVDLQTKLSSESASSLKVGNGVEAKNIIRMADAYLQNTLQGASSTKGQTGVELEFTNRIESLFSLTGEGNTIGSVMTEFFSSVNDLSLNPSSIELRSNVTERLQDVVNTIKSTYNTVADLQTEADNRLGPEIDNVNAITSQIARLNGLISGSESTGQVAADERDRRDVLMKQLSEKISFTSVERSDGTVLISLPNGFPLVNGVESRALALTSSPSFSPGTLPPSLGGGVLRYIVYEYDQSGGGSAQIDLTPMISEGGGTIGGLLNIRGTNDASNTSAFQGEGVLVEVGKRIEAVTRTLLTTINAAYRGATDETPGGVFQSRAGDLNGNPPDVYGLFSFEAGFALDADGNGIPDDLAAATTAGVDNFSSRLQAGFTDPARFAAALDLDAASGVTAFEPGDGENATNLASLLNSNFTFSSGSFSLTTTFSGVYNESVTYVGNQKSRALLDDSVAESNLISAQSRRDEFSGVSLDEEFTNLIRFQRAYQASARMIKIADELTEQVVNLI